MGMTQVLRSFVAAVFGWYRNYSGLLGWFVIGLLETLQQPFGMSDFRDAIVYGI